MKNVENAQIELCFQCLFESLWSNESVFSKPICADYIVETNSVVKNEYFWNWTGPTESTTEHTNKHTNAHGFRTHTKSTTNFLRSTAFSFFSIRESVARSFSIRLARCVAVLVKIECLAKMSERNQMLQPNDCQWPEKKEERVKQHPNTRTTQSSQQNTKLTGKTK